ncbi:Cytidine deaminase [hydrothermal vent metagenome]|uniref:Cytidine deaminase n=1 Tax=hydrothermal vent metagenome TaxID=652676 RepID=A0A1W1EE31_9ZZZZ
MINYYDDLILLLDASSAPYSGFNVASIVVDKDGNSFKGVNVESVAYPTTMCAERTAIFSAIASGVKSGDIVEVHILARNIDKKIMRAFPCGSCRQVIAEQSKNEATIYVYASKKDVLEHKISELLPNAFFTLD